MAYLKSHLGIDEESKAGTDLAIVNSVPPKSEPNRGEDFSSLEALGAESIQHKEQDNDEQLFTPVEVDPNLPTAQTHLRSISEDERYQGALR